MGCSLARGCLLGERHERLLGGVGDGVGGGGGGDERVLFLDVDVGGGLLRRGVLGRRRLEGGLLFGARRLFVAELLPLRRLWCGGEEGAAAQGRGPLPVVGGGAGAGWTWLV
jgi:hypothetical protein